MTENDYRVDCCADECGWTGLASECVTFKHWPEKLLCPECHEVVESEAQLASFDELGEP